MSRRRKKDPPDSTHPSSYGPHESKYWLYGGKWIPPEEIAPRTSKRPENVRTYEKPATRYKSVGKMLDEAREQLADRIAHYRDLHERGVEALKWGWEKERMREGHRDPNEPTPLHYSLCNAYRDIESLKGDIPVYEEILDGLTPGQMPLFSRRKGS